MLEDLETQFYSQALAKFQASDFTAAGFSDPNIPIQQFTAIGSDESTHLTTIQVRLQSLHTVNSRNDNICCRTRSSPSVPALFLGASSTSRAR